MTDKPHWEYFKNLHFPEINLDDYQILKKIRNTTFSVCRLAQEIQTGRKVELNFFYNSNEGDLEYFYRSINTCLLDFPGINKPIGSRFPLYEGGSDSDYPDVFIIVQEYMENGTLSEPNTIINPTRRSKIIFGISAIMKKIHKRNIIHRDLKPENVFLDSNFEPQIGGFEVSIYVDNALDLEGFAGTPICMSPEMINGLGYGTPTDVYSYAVLLYRMFSDEFRFGKETIQSGQFQLIREIASGNRPAKPEKIPEHYWELIQRCSSQDPNKRPTFEEITEILKDDKYALREEGEVNMDELHEYQQRIDSYHRISENDICKMKSFIRVLKEKSTESIELVNFEDYEEGSVIGEGATSTVKEVWKKEKYAKKELKQFDHPTLQRFLKETEILFRLRHPCIVRIFGFDYGAKTRPPSIYLSLEPTSLETSIRNHELSNEDKNRITVEIVLGMRYIHSQKLMHRDLKPGNILLSKHKHVRISDFGLVKEEDLGSSQTKGIGTLRFMAPELLDEDETNTVTYTNKIDVYAFGIILIYIINEDYPPFKMSRVIKGILPSLPSTMISWVVDLIKSCLSVSSDDRPTFDEIFSILKSHQFDLFSETYPSKPSAIQRKSKEEIEHRILKIEAFEYQHNI